MMTTQADLVAWRDRLLQAMLSGTRRVRDTDGSEIEYRSQSELQAAYNWVNSQLNPQQIKTLKFQTSKGL